jgi:hypothetical protein
MVTLQSLAQKFSSTLGLRARAPDVNTLRALCLELLVDVPEARRNALLQRLEKMRRADDVWHVRSALFEAISLTHGEQVARDRLLVLDDKLG